MRPTSSQRHEVTTCRRIHLDTGRARVRDADPAPTGSDASSTRYVTCKARGTSRTIPCAGWRRCRIGHRGTTQGTPGPTPWRFEIWWRRRSDSPATCWSPDTRRFFAAGWPQAISRRWLARWAETARTCRGTIVHGWSWSSPTYSCASPPMPTTGPEPRGHVGIDALGRVRGRTGVVAVDPLRVLRTLNGHLGR